MKTILYFFLAIVAVFSLSSCSQEGKYKDFATRVASAISQNDTAALKKMIYGGDEVNFSNFKFTGIDVSKAKMAKLDDGGYRVDCGAQYLEIKPVYGDSLSVVEAGNIFTCKDSVMTRVAKQRGFIKDGDDDITILRNISTEEFSIVWKQHWAVINRQAVRDNAAAQAKSKIDQDLANYRKIVNRVVAIINMSHGIDMEELSRAENAEGRLEHQKSVMTPSQRATFSSLKNI